MRRCAICDYAEGVGSDMLGIPNDNRKVVWRETHQEFQCDDCCTSIRDTVFEQELEDAQKEMTEEQDEITDEQLEVCGVPPAVSGLPF